MYYYAWIKYKLLESAKKYVFKHTKSTINPGQRLQLKGSNFTVKDVVVKEDAKQGLVAMIELENDTYTLRRKTTFTIEEGFKHED